MILIISCVFPPEPVVSANISYNIANALANRWEVKVVTPRPTRPYSFNFKKHLPDDQKFEQVIVRSFTCPKSILFCRMRESYSFGKEVSKLIKENSSKIIHAYVNSWPLLSQYYIMKTCLKYSIPVTIHIQDLYPETLLSKIPVFGIFLCKLLLPIDKFILRNANHIFTIASKMKEYLIDTRELETKKVDVIYNWPDDSLFEGFNKSKPANNKGLFTFMFLGSLSPSAALRHIIYSFGQCDIPNSRLVIAGSGTEKETLVFLAKKFKNRRIEFWDVQKDKVPQIQALADVLLLSLRKGAARFALPSKLSYYMLSEKPIIACVDEDSDAANIINDSRCGWVVPAEDIKALNTAMKECISIPDHDLKRMGNNGLKYVKRNFSKSKNLNKIVKIITGSLTL